MPSRISTPVRAGMCARNCRHTCSARHGAWVMKVLEGLIRARIADAREHRTHRLAGTVAEEPEEIATKRAPLRDVAEGRLEGLQPRQQTIDPRGRIRGEHQATADPTPRAGDPLERFEKAELEHS